VLGLHPLYILSSEETTSTLLKSLVSQNVTYCYTVIKQGRVPEEIFLALLPNKKPGNFNQKHAVDLFKSTSKNINITLTKIKLLIF
jgi:hypothetical protein